MTLVFSGGKLKAMKNEEVRCYLAIIAITISIITFNIRGLYPSIMEAFQQAAFQVGSIDHHRFATTIQHLAPGFPDDSRHADVLVGACAGSTGGGIKVSRFVILLKTVNNSSPVSSSQGSTQDIRWMGRLWNMR